MKYKKEGISFEAKSARNGIPNDFWETYSAFANTFGGTIVFGISEGESRELILTGVEEPEKTVKTLWDNLNNPRFVNYNILKDENIRIESIGEQKIIVIEVPSADRQHRPIYIKNNINSGTFKRNHEGDYHCRITEIKEMIRDSENGYQDDKPIPELDLNCFNEETISAYLSELSTRRPNHPWVRIERCAFLEMSGAAAPYEGRLCPTAAGLLMFGKVHCIRRMFNGYFLDYREVSSESRYDYRIHSNSGEWSGNLYDFVNSVMTRLMFRLGDSFNMKGFINEGVSETYISLREAVMNAVLHADYNNSTGITVVYRSDSVTVTNPGTMRIKLSDALKGGKSDARNGSLMVMAMCIGWVEHIGSGLFMINRACEKGALAGFRLDELSDPSTVSVNLVLPKNNVTLGRNSESVLKLLREDNTLTREELAEYLGISTATVSNSINELKKSGKIIREGNRKTGYWKVID